MTNIDDILSKIFEDTNVDIKVEFDDKLNEYGLTKTKALKLLNIDKDVFEDIVNGSAKQPNLIHIIKIAEFLQYDLNEFISIVLKNQSEKNIKAIENAKNTAFILKHFDVNNLTKLGFFEKKSTSEELVKKVLDYFGFETILDFENELTAPLYSRVKRNHSDKMTEFWIQSAYQTFKNINNPNDYNREVLKDIIVKIKPYSQDVNNGLLTVCKALYNAGVTVIFQNYLSTTQVRGATFIINDKPCVLITDFKKSYPTLWFTLLHELNHVLFDFDLINQNSYHLSDDKDLFLIEDKADNFARDYFMSVEKFHFIKRYINNPYMVSKFANDLEIHESIVYSFFIWYQSNLYKKNYHGAFNKFYPEFSETIKKLNPIVWNGTTIKNTSEKIKSILEI
ncbi:ImmA/IrrE family metallo-endopeptidase [Empedobacter brevis]